MANRTRDKFGTLKSRGIKDSNKIKLQRPDLKRPKPGPKSLPRRRCTVSTSLTIAYGLQH